jgi:hypothetical protein
MAQANGEIDVAMQSGVGAWFRQPVEFHKTRQAALRSANCSHFPTTARPCGAARQDTCAPHDATGGTSNDGSQNVFHGDGGLRRRMRRRRADP